MALNWFSLRQAARGRLSPDVAESARHPAQAGRTAHGRAAPAAADGPSVSWPDLVRLMGEEVSTSLAAASEQLDRLNGLEPSLVNGLAPLRDAIERARQAGLAAQHVLRLNEDPPAQQREVLNLADVARAALTARGDWFQRRHVNVRQGLAQAQVFADSSMVYLLIDELLQWAGQLSDDVVITVDKSQAAHARACGLPPGAPRPPCPNPAGAACAGCCGTSWRGRWARKPRWKCAKTTCA